MAQTDFIHAVDVERVPDLIHRVRRLSFFEQHVAQGIRAIGRHEHMTATLDPKVAPQVFWDWVQCVDTWKGCAQINRRDYIAFSAGLLFDHMIAHDAIRANILPSPEGLSGTKLEIIRFWPAGFAAMSYCITVLDTVIRQEGLEPFVVQPVAEDLSAWWSMRENIIENPALAVPFFDLFIGNEPNWNSPDNPFERKAIRAAAGPGRIQAH